MEFLTLDPATFTYGAASEVAPLVRRVIAENPSKFTYHGTGTYIVGERRRRRDRPRPAARHAIATRCTRALAGEHGAGDPRDPLPCRPLAAGGLAARRDRCADRRLRPASRRPLGHRRRPDRTRTADDRRAMPPSRRPARRGGVKIEESIDLAFEPDVVVADRRRRGGRRTGWTMTALHTPGHTSNHLCFALDEDGVTLFTGDHVMGWSTTVVSPPDGDMAAYIDSLRNGGRARTTTCWPDPRPADRRAAASSSTACVAHRLDRERQVLDAVRDGLREIADDRAACSTPTSTSGCTSRPARACSPTSASSSTTDSSSWSTAARPASTAPIAPT